MEARHWKDLHTKLRQLGYTVQRARKRNHFHVRNNLGHLISTLPHSPSGPRSYRNQLADLRRQGIPV